MQTTGWPRRYRRIPLALQVEAREIALVVDVEAVVEGLVFARRGAVAGERREVVEGLGVGLGLAVEVVDARDEVEARAQAPGDMAVEVDVVGRQILVEGPSRKNGERMMGRTRCGKIVLFDGSGRHRGQLMDVRITRTGSFTLYGDPAILG